MTKQEQEVVKLAKRLIRGRDPDYEDIDGDATKRMWRFSHDMRVTCWTDDDGIEAWAITTHWLDDEPDWD